MSRSLSAVSSLEVRNLNYDQIRFYHPGYLKPLNLLFCLPRVDYSAEDNAYGVHYRTALTACQIVANNAFEKGKLARDDKGQDIVADDEKVLLDRDYWFFIEDDGNMDVLSDGYETDTAQNDMLLCRLSTTGSSHTISSRTGGSPRLRHLASTPSDAP